MDPRFFLPCFHGPRAPRLGHKRKEKTRSITCHTDRANEANKRYLYIQGKGESEVEISAAVFADVRIRSQLPIKVPCSI